MTGAGQIVRRWTEDFRNYWPRKGKTVRVVQEGIPAAQPTWYALLFLGFGISSLSMACFELLNTLKYDVWNLYLFLYFLLFGVACTASGLRILYMRVDLRRTSPSEDLSQKLGVSETELGQMVEAQGIVPRYNINGRDFYRVEDFDVSSLLRAATAPLPTAELLRAATYSPTPSELLVRSSSAPVPAHATSDVGSAKVMPSEETAAEARVRVGTE